MGAQDMEDENNMKAWGAQVRAELELFKTLCSDPCVKDDTSPLDWWREHGVQSAHAEGCGSLESFLVCRHLKLSVSVSSPRQV